MARVFSRLNRENLRTLSVAIIAAGLVLLGPVATLSAQEETPPDDVAEEEKDSKKEQKIGKGSNFIPLPIFVTEPAIDYGLGAALGYFHPRKDEVEDPSAAPALTTGKPPTEGIEKERRRPPTISGIAAAYTEKGTWAAGFGHAW